MQANGPQNIGANALSVGTTKADLQEFPDQMQGLHILHGRKGAAVTASLFHRASLV